MFKECLSLTNLDLSNFNTNNVTNKKNIFHACKKLTKDNVITKDKQILNNFK